MTYTPPAVIDADSHVIESNLTWDYLEPSEEKYRPKIVVDNGNPNVKKWDVNGEVRAFVVETVEAPDGIGTTAGKSDRNVGTPAKTRQLKDIAGRLKHMDALDIDNQILHNSLWLYSLTTDPDAEATLTFAWNKWVAATWAKSNGRLPWSCLVPTLMPGEAIRQIRWARERGAVAVFMRPCEDDRFLTDESFYPIYEEAQNLDMSIAVHIANGNHANVEYMQQAAGGNRGMTFGIFRLPTTLSCMMLVMSDIKESFPSLRWGFIESSSQWMPWIYNEAARRIELTGQQAPTDLFEQKNIFVTCQTDDDLPWILKYAGENSLLIGPDYGHSDPSFDMDATIGLRNYEGISDQAKDNILFHNPKKLFALDIEGRVVRSVLE